MLGFVGLDLGSPKMVSNWNKVKVALGRNLCVYVPRTSSEEQPPPPPGADSADRLSDVDLRSSPNSTWTVHSSGTPAAPQELGPFSSASRLSKSSSRSSKKNCSICLASIKQGDGHAIFTAECSHPFHFHCITSNVKHGNQTCPVCRAKWKEIPFQSPSLDPPLRRARITSGTLPQSNALMTVIRRLPNPRPELNRQVMPLHQSPEPPVFDDDENLDCQLESAERSEDKNIKTVDMKAYPEVSAIPRSKTCDEFMVLVHLKAAGAFLGKYPQGNQPSLALPKSQSPRASVDLVTVLDVSGSMAGTKLALLKRAMGFVIQNLGSNDRLSVIAFSSTARRLFPLRRMSDTGRQQALQAVNSLAANGGTNIAEGLKKGVKVMEQRREKNSVASLILLSDGQDTYSVNGSSGSNQHQPNYHLLLPMSVQGGDGNTGFQIPVHTFGFGADHDASSMHSISHTSGGTFSFIETEAVIQDAFAQCIGGLLSVVVQEMQIEVECVHPGLLLRSLKVGSYRNRVDVDGRTGFIDVGDLYADEERDFLVSLDVPEESVGDETFLLKVRCIYKDPFTKETATVETEEVSIKRPEIVAQELVSVEVDRQRNRLQAADAMAKARAAAEQGDLNGADFILENCRKALLETLSGKSNDRLCIALDAELKEMQERLVSRHVYEASGRAYILSGLSSHSWQRATARGDSTDGSSLVQAYQTPLMTEMLYRSQAMLLGSSSAPGLSRPLWSSQPKPR